MSGSVTRAAALVLIALLVGALAGCAPPQGDVGVPTPRPTVAATARPIVAPTEAAAVTPAPTPRPTPKPTPTEAPVVTPEPATEPPAPVEVYYANCAAVRAAGAAPLHQGDPGYRSALDRDNDGVACE